MKTCQLRVFVKRALLIRLTVGKMAIALMAGAIAYFIEVKRGVT